MLYVEALKKHCNNVRRTFCDAIDDRSFDNLIQNRYITARWTQVTVLYCEMAVSSHKKRI